MSSAAYLILLLGVILDLAFIIVDDKFHGKSSIFLKTAASLLFVILALINYRGGFESLLIIGLVFDAIGDFILILRNIDKKHNDILYAIGTVSFFIAHLFILVYLSNLSKSILLPSVIITTLLYALIGVKFINSLNVKGILNKVGRVYLYTISLTCIASIIVLFVDYSFSNIILMIGLILFTISDFILVVHKFLLKSKNYLQPLYRVVYYASQLLVAIYIGLK